MRRNASRGTSLRILGISGKLVVILVSVGIFVYVVETARWFVRLLAGMPSFVALLSIVVFGVAELIWFIVVSEDSLPDGREAILRRMVWFLGWEGVVAALLILVPKTTVAIAADVSLSVLYGPWEIVAMAAGLGAATVARVLLRR
jgi:hypothetical protein